MNGLFVGLTTLDLIYYVEASPEEDYKTYSERQVLVPGGMAMNASIAFSGMGGSSKLITLIGNRFRNSIDDHLDLINQNIEILDISKSRDESLPLSTVIVNTSNGSRTILNPPISTRSLAIKIIDIAPFDIVMVDGFYPEISIPIARLAKENGIPVVMDSGSWKPQMESLLNYVDYLIVPRSFRPPSIKTFEDTRIYLDKFDFKGLAFTDGANEVTAYHYLEKSILHPQKIKCIDSLAAGDILHGSFCFNFLKQQNFITSLKNAILTATESCRYEGPHEWIQHLRK